MTYFFIQNMETGMVLDVKQENRAASTPIILWTYKASANQLWSYRNNMLYSKMNGMVLDVSPAGHLIIYPAHGRPNQRWYFEGEYIRNGNGKYLDIAEQNRSAGAKVITFPINHGWNQKFRTVPF